METEKVNDDVLFKKFLDDFTLGREELKDLLQEFIGKALTGDINEKYCLVLCGDFVHSGINDLICLLMAMFGSLSATVPKDIFIELKRENRNKEVIPLVGKRLVFVDALRGETLDAGKVKSIINGGLSIAARANHKSWTQIKLQCHFILTSNKKVIFNEDDPSLKRRLLFFPCDCNFVDNPAQPNERTKYDLIVTQELINVAFEFFVEGSHRVLNSSQGIKVPHDILHNF